MSYERIFNAEIAASSNGAVVASATYASIGYSFSDCGASVCLGIRFPTVLAHTMLSPAEARIVAANLLAAADAADAHLAARDAA